MRQLLLVILALAFVGPAARAEIVLPSVISDRMVLQRDKKVTIWGKADPGEKIILNLSRVDGEKAGEQRTTTANKKGDWNIRLSAYPSGGEWTVTLAGTKTKKPIVIKDVVFGEVWVASGQSNMSWTVANSANAKDEIANSANDQIRMWTAQRTVSDKPAFNVSGKWEHASPKTTGDFSAVAYAYARKLHEELGVPVGVLHSSWGGTPVEAWTSTQKLKSIDWAKPILDRYKVALKAYPAKKKQYQDAVAYWERTRHGPPNQGEPKGYATQGFDDRKWKSMKLPQAWEQGGLGEKDGVVWFRKTIDLPAGWEGKTLRLSLGPIDDGDTTYVNGKQVGATSPANSGAWKVPRVYNIHNSLVKKGKLTIAVRVVDFNGSGGLWGKPEQLTLARSDGQGEALSIAGDWKYLFVQEINASNRPVRPPSLPLGPEHPHSPAGLFNGMIHPILPYTIKGAIWYQGESNASRAQQYRKLFPGMIQDWRKRWGQGDFPFLFVQLANYRRATDKVVDTDWAHLRDAQLHTLRTVKNTGMAVTTDIGAANDIHPRNKQDVGKRLARWALADSYGKKEVVKSGPIFREGTMRAIEGKAMLLFDTFGSKLAVRGTDTQEQVIRVSGFTVAGKDGKFYPATADVLIPNGTVAVWSDKVKEPVAVRYAWEDNPDEADLVNEEGLPASPFRTDDWKGPTDDRR